MHTKSQTYKKSTRITRPVAIEEDPLASFLYDSGIKFGDIVFSSEAMQYWLNRHDRRRRSCSPLSVRRIAEEFCETVSSDKVHLVKTVRLVFWFELLNYIIASLAADHPLYILGFDFKSFKFKSVMIDELDVLDSPNGVIHNLKYKGEEVRLPQLSLVCYFNRVR